MFSKTCRERGEKILFGYVWTHPESAGSDYIPGHVPTNMSQSASWMLLLTFSTCYSHRTLFPPAASRHHACQLVHQRMSNPLPATHSLHNVNNNKNCVLKSANFTQRQQLHSHIVQHQHCFSKSDTLQTQLRTGTWKHGMKAPTLSIYLTPVKWI